MGWSSGLAGRLGAIMAGKKPDLSGVNTGVAGPAMQAPSQGFVGPMVNAGLPQRPQNPGLGAAMAMGKPAFGMSAPRKPVMSGPPPRKQGPRMARMRTF